MSFLPNKTKSIILKFFFIELNQVNFYLFIFQFKPAEILY